MSRRAYEPPERALPPIDGRPPPHDLDAEAAVVGSTIVGGRGVVEELADWIAPEDFYSESHRRIFEAAVALYREGEQEIGVVEIANRLKSANRIEQVGGVGYLTELINFVPNIQPTAVRSAAEIVVGKHRLRRMIALCQRAVAHGYHGVENPRAFIEQFESDVRALATERAQGKLTHISEHLDAAYAAMVEQHQRGVAVTGVPTGFPSLDEQTGGLHEGDLTFIGARPGMGKTSFAMNVAEYVAGAGYAAIVFSLEMPNDQLAQRMMCSRAPANLQKARTAGLDAADWPKIERAKAQLEALRILVDDSPGATLADVRSATRRVRADMQRQGVRVGVVVVDHLQIMNHGEGDNLAQAIGETTKGLKAMAKELRIPVVVLAQLNRRVEERADKRPMLSDIRDSGNVEQDADNILFLYRDEYYRGKKSEHPGVVEVIIAKQRNGPVGSVNLGFQSWSTTFLDNKKTQSEEEFS